MCKLYDSSEAKEAIEKGVVIEPNFSLCDTCGEKVHVGDWPICNGAHGGHEPQGRYRPFIPFWDPNVATKASWEDPRRGVYVDSLAKWNKLMKRNGWEMGSKHDRERPHPLQERAEQINRQFNIAFNRSAREVAGGIVDLSGLRDDD